MRILFLVGGAEIAVPTDQLSTDTILSTATVYNFFLRRTLDLIPGIETSSRHFRKVSDPARAVSYVRTLEPPEADHVICLEQRGFAATDVAVFDFYRAHTPGAVCAICDHDRVLGPEDYLFHVQPSMRLPRSPKSVHVPWAASPEYCYPDKEPGTLNILVDHQNYSGEDRSPEVLESLVRFSRELFPRLGPRYGFERLVVRRFVSGGLEVVDLGALPEDEPYNRKGLPFPQACAEYRRADIFMVTKPESMGLSMIECAMSGALVVAPRGYASPYLLEPLNHLFWQDYIDWEKVMALIDVGASARAAAIYNWQSLAQTMLNTLRLHGRAGSTT